MCSFDDVQGWNMTWYWTHFLGSTYMQDTSAKNFLQLGGQLQSCTSAQTSPTPSLTVTLTTSPFGGLQRGRGSRAGPQRVHVSLFPKQKRGRPKRQPRSIKLPDKQQRGNAYAAAAELQLPPVFQAECPACVAKNVKQVYQKYDGRK